MKCFFFCLMLLFSFISGAQEHATLKEVIGALDAIDRKYQSADWLTDYAYLTIEQRTDKAAEIKEQYEKLKKVTRSELDRQDQITQSTLLLKLGDELSDMRFKTYLMPFNAEGGFYGRPSFLIGSRTFQTLEDYENYQLWVVSFLGYLKYNQHVLKVGIREGVMRPRVIVRNNLALLEAWTGQLEDHVFYQPYLRVPEALGSEAKRIVEEGARLVQQQVIPAYIELRHFLETEYLPKAPEQVGITSIPNGRAYYEDRIAFYTTHPMTPDSVFNLGHAEVARIKKLMERIIAELNFDGNFETFIQFLRTDPQFYAKSPEELLSKAAWISKKAEGCLPRFFSHLYELPFTVEAVPASIAPNYTGGRYVPGNRALDKPGIYWVNTYNLSSRPLYTLPALTLHEAVPGHHLGMMIAAESTKKVPELRKHYYISAYGEGWGLYAEYLGEEMGIYQTPYELFGRYTYEMWRACRLVVDVGLHYKGWSRDEAVSFLRDHTALSIHEVNTEIDRYIGWPGQAVSYKVGELTIKRLRAEAEERLGDTFSIQQFHEVVLTNGSVPLSELKREVELFIANQLD